MLRVQRLGSLLAAFAVLTFGGPGTAGADPWPRERHGVLGSYRVVHDFDASIDRPGGPVGTSLIGPNGLYYGVSSNGGPTSEGTIYRMNADGSITTLHVFDTATGRDPGRGLTLGGDGQFYGTTTEGGPYHYGVVYRMSADGTYTVLHAFDDTPGGGRHPNTRLVEGPDGNFYGTTAGGGTHHGHGTFFRITPAGQLTTLYSFRNDGQHEPYTSSDFCFGPDGAIYAMGRNAAFRVAMDGSSAEMRRFSPEKHGFLGLPGLIRGTDGHLYGAMTEGGPRQGGTVFRLSLDGELTILHAFTGPNDPEYAGQAYRPTGPLMQAADGALYGTLTFGGKWGYGGAFRVVPGHGLQPLADFAGWGQSDTEGPIGALVQTADGFLLGTGYGGGLHHQGTVYALIPSP
ncbi:choice-of-anchor tandem repeat GloVer-containing protein [Ideonella sp. YS5]|uniref:choice-of-anchor tandem repeat GloVer-containing protein n=1 Tax=Ideonella sp. YS5 TaxID=3453714 RepID=UPI003EEE948C